MSSPQKTPRFDLMVIGGGIGGAAAALRAVQYHLKTLWIQGSASSRLASRAHWVVNIDNMIGFHDQLLLSKILKALSPSLRLQAEAELKSKGKHFHISTRDIVQNTISRISSEYAPFCTFVKKDCERLEKYGALFTAHFEKESASSEAVLLSTGVMDFQPKLRGAPPEKAMDWIFPFANRETALYCIRCEGHLTRNQKVAVLGHSENAAQVALMLSERYGSAACLLLNGEEPQLAPETAQLLEIYRIPVHGAPIQKALSERPGELRGFLLENGEEVRVNFVFVSLGLYLVRNELARQVGAELEKGVEEKLQHVLIDARGETSVRNLFAVGDMAKRLDEPVMKQVYTAQEYAVRAVDTVDRRRRRRLREKKLAAAFS